MVEIVQDFIKPGRRNRPGYRLEPKWITVHDTGNPKPGADALAHARYLHSDSAANLPVSWHFTVDDKRIVQHLPLDENGWHAGDGSSGVGNRASIGIEICEHQGIDRGLAEQNAKELIASLLGQFSLGIVAVVPHKRWNGKNCPHLILPRWDAFVNDIRQLIMPAGTPIAGPPLVGKDQAKLWASQRGATRDFIAMADFYWEWAPRFGIRPEVAYAQAAKETAFGRFPGVVPREYHNWCGLKTRAGGSDSDPNAHARFPNDYEGGWGHLEHLARYAGLPLPPDVPLVDPRYDLVQPGSARTVEELGGRWAPNPDYGRSIVRDYLAPMMRTLVSQPEAPPAEETVPFSEYKRVVDERDALREKIDRIREIVA